MMQRRSLIQVRRKSVGSSDEEDTDYTSKPLPANLPRRRSNSMDFPRPNVPPPLSIQSTSWSAAVESPKISQHPMTPNKGSGGYSSTTSSILSSTSGEFGPGSQQPPSLICISDSPPSSSIASSVPISSAIQDNNSSEDYFSSPPSLRRSHLSSSSAGNVLAATPHHHHSASLDGKSTSSPQFDWKEPSQKSARAVYDPVLFNVMDLLPKQIAKQMALVDHSFFKKIKKEEFLSLAWGGPDKMTKAPNITTFIQRFNNLTLWVSREILDSKNVRRRAEKVEYFINLAKACFEIQNFNGLKTILGGLQCTPVYRLSKTWALVGRQKANFDSLVELMSADNNYERYRKRLGKCKAPCVPYLGVHMSDIVYAVEAKAKAVDKAVANKNVDQLLDDLLQFQSTPYDFKDVSVALEFLSSPKFISELEPFYEDKNYEVSLQLEPKEDELIPVESHPDTGRGTPSKNFFNRRSIPKPKEGILDDLPVEEPPKPSKILLYDGTDTESSENDDETHGPSKFFTAASRESFDDLAAFQGFLIKKDLTLDYKRAKNRSWRRYFVVLRGGSLMFYKEKHAQKSSTQNPSTQIDLGIESFITLATDYKKRKNVLRFLPQQGTEVFLEAASEEEAKGWLSSVEAAIQKKRNPKRDLINL